MYILVGLSSCTVYDAFMVSRCYRCNGFHHGKNSCKNDISCPLCSDKHSVKECKADESNRKCRNCVGLVKNQKWDVKYDHAAWDIHKCFAYKYAVAKVTTDLFGIPISLTPDRIINAEDQHNSNLM